MLQTRNGQEIPVEVTTRQVNIDGVQRLQWVFRDISERTRLEHLREDLTFMIYHDLRAPLANVTYSLEALEQLLPEQEDEAARSVIDIAARSTERIKRLTDSLLDIQRLEAGQALAKLTLTSVTDLVQESIETVRSIAESKEQEIQLSVDRSLPQVKVDSEMIQRVIINLIENAIKFNGRGGEITVGARRDGEWMQFWVQDHGPGIPPEDQGKIFNKFARLSSQTQGFGLGLAFCQLAVEAHGGRIWVESEEGSGATFYFSLPAVQD
jgi:signal transduction histidine kinase